MSLEDKRYYGTSRAYQSRWEKVQDQRTTLYADLLEAEAIWGESINDLFKILFDLEHELFVEIRHYLQILDPQTEESHKSEIIKAAGKRRNIKYDSLSQQPDEFKSDMLTAIRNIEIYLKPKLNHDAA